MDPISQPFRSTGAMVGGSGRGRSEAVGQRCVEKSVCRKGNGGHSIPLTPMKLLTHAGKQKIPSSSLLSTPAPL